MVDLPSSSSRAPMVAMQVENTPQGVIVQNMSLGGCDPGSIRVKDDPVDPPLAEELTIDSGSEVGDDEESETKAALQELLGYDNIPETEVDDSLPTDLIWSEDRAFFSGSLERFWRCHGPGIIGTSPSGLFTQLWDLKLIETIVNYTNSYARESIELASKTGIPPQSRLNHWVETTVGEIYRLIAVMILMSMCIRDSIDEYWSTGTLGMPGFRKLMSKDRFLLLVRFLHFSDNNELNATGADRKIAKIEPVLTYLNDQFKTVYTPRRELTLAESLLTSSMQCIHSKAARFGIKSYELCEAITGYVLTIVLRSDEASSTSEPVFGFTSETAKIVINVMRFYVGNGYSLFTNSFFNSVPLTRWLKSQKTDVIGTLDRHRAGTPLEIRSLDERSAPRGMIMSRHCGDVSIMAWKETEIITTVSTYHHADTRYTMPGHIRKPLVFEHYKEFMHRADVKDLKLSMHLLERKGSLKWYIEIFRGLVHTSVFNTYIIYCANLGQGKKLTERQFRYALVNELCDHFGVDIQPRARTGNSCGRLNRTLGHYPEHTLIEQERTTKQDRYKRGRCVRCAAKKERKVSNIVCSQCKVFLCAGQCWKEYHTLELL